MTSSAFKLPPRGSRRGTLNIAALLADIGAVFVWEDGAENSENLHGSFASLYAALTSAPPGPKTVLVRGEGTIPAGAYALRNVRLVAEDAYTGADLFVEEGVTFTSRPPEFEGLTLECNTNAPIFVIGAELVLRRCNLYATAPVLDGGKVLLFDTVVRGPDYGESTTAAFQATGVKTLHLELHGTSALAEDAVEGDAGASLTVVLCSVEAAASPTQSAFAGSLTRRGLDNAEDLPDPNYIDANLALRADLNGRFGPWRHTAPVSGVGPTTAEDKQRVVLVDGGQAGTVNAPASPFAGMRFGIKLCGASLSANVTLSGNGANIEDPSTRGTVGASGSWTGGDGGFVEFEYFHSAWWIVAIG